MAKKPYIPSHLVKSRMIPVRVSEEYSQWLYAASSRLGVSISDMMREGARIYAMQLEQKGEPRKEIEHYGSQEVLSERDRKRSKSEKRDRLQASVSKTKTGRRLDRNHRDPAGLPQQKGGPENLG